MVRQETTLKKVFYLEFEDAMKLLRKEGIPREQLWRYKNTEWGACESFYGYLEQLDIDGRIGEREGRLYEVCPSPQTA